jgi:hypothetical protein
MWLNCDIDFQVAIKYFCVITDIEDASQQIDLHTNFKMIFSKLFQIIIIANGDNKNCLIASVNTS